MNILISGGFFNLTPCADNNIEVRLAHEIMKQGHSCDVVGMTYDIEPSFVMMGDVRVYKIPYVWECILQARSSMKEAFHTDGTVPIASKAKILYLLKHPYYSTLMRMNKIPSIREHMLTDYTTAVGKLIAQNHYDALIGTVFSFDQTYDLFLSETIKITKLYFQLDPYGLHEQGDKAAPRGIDAEVQAMHKADAVLTTPELLEEYKNNEAYAGVISKMSSYWFPTFDPVSLKTNIKTEYDAAEINLLFAGSINAFDRNPMEALKTMKRVMERNRKIHLYFLGNFDYPKAKEYIKNNHMNVTIHPQVSPEEAKVWMKNADILVSIGNHFHNMVPSKMFTYFSAGKPILNFQVIPDSPELKYDAMYSCMHICKLYDERDQTDEIADFIRLYAKSSEDMEKVMRAYEKASPEYVAGQLIDILQKSRYNH